MYNAQDLADKIKKMSREKRIIQGEMLKKIGCNTSILNQISEEKGIASFTLAKIADELDCSTDYLLDRTDNPNAHKTCKDNNKMSTTDDQLAEIIKIYDQLSPLGKAKVYVFIDEVLGKERTGNLP